MLEKLLLLFCLYLPFQLALRPATDIDLASVRIFIPLLFIFWLIQSLKRKRLLIPSSASALFLYSFIFFLSFSLFWAQNPFWGLRKILFVLSIFPLFWLFSQKFQQKFYWQTFKFLALGSFFLALIGLGQFLSQFIFAINNLQNFWGKIISPIFLGPSFSAAVWEHSSWLVNVGGKTIFRAVSIFPDPHMFSFYLGLTAPLALAYYLKTKNKKFLLVFLLIFIVNLLTFSRGGYLGIIFASFAFLSYFIKKNSTINFRKAARIAFTIFLFITILATLSPVRQRFLDTFDFQEGSNLGRIELWKKSWQIFKQHPLGVGLGNLPLAIEPTTNYRDPIYAHNLYLDILTESGFFGLIFYLLTIISTLVFLFKRRHDWFYLGIFSSLIFFSSYSLVETPLYSVHVLSIFFILLALAQNNEVTKND